MKTTFRQGQQVYWAYPHDDIPSQFYIVAENYPPVSGSGSYVELVDPGRPNYLALPEELSECTPPTSEDQPAAPVTRAGQPLGTITCIQGGDGLRWFGRKHESPITGNGHPTPEAAVQDVVDWADGKEVKYTRHCVGCATCEKGGVKA